MNKHFYQVLHFKKIYLVYLNEEDWLRFGDSGAEGLLRIGLGMEAEAKAGPVEALSAIPWRIKGFSIKGLLGVGARLSF